MSGPMTPEQLREKVARAIDPGAWGPPHNRWRGVQPKGTSEEELLDMWRRATSPRIHESLRLADAAILVCREHFAALADADNRHGYEPYEAVDRIVKAIRSEGEK